MARKGLAHARIPDENEVGSLGQEFQVEQTQDTRLGLLPTFVVVEMESVDAGLDLQARTLESALDGALITSFQFHVGEPLQGGRYAEILGRSISQSRLQLAAHGREIQLIQLLFESRHRIPFREQG